MQKKHYSIIINAPREKVWDTMLGRETYREWTKVFSPGSDYSGSWDQGSEIRFIGSDGGGGSGMLARIKENRPYEFISIEHYGMIENGVVDTTSDKVKAWAGAHENYTFVERDGGTEVLVDMDVEDQYAQMFDDMWPRAMQTLKELAER